MTVLLADDFAAIKARLAAIEQEKIAARAKQDQAADATFENSPWTNGRTPSVADIMSGGY